MPDPPSCLEKALYSELRLFVRQLQKHFELWEFLPSSLSPLPFLNTNFYEPVFISQLQKAHRDIGSSALQCLIHHAFIS